MTHVNRRDFMKGALVAGAALAMPTRSVLGANEEMRVGIIGCGGRGTGHVGWANGCKGAKVVAVSDPDEGRMASAADKLDHEVKQYQDFRDLLDDDSIDAVAIASPNHWHALHTIMACQAGKDVYVEKPASHSVWEGRKMVEAARKYDRIVQVGTQQRSDPALITLREMIEEKELGEVQWIHSLWYANRSAIGKVKGPQPIPENVDYALWCGPRDPVPLMRKRFHYDWHWFFDYGNGDMGNRTIHCIDDVHHVMQMGEDIPTEMMSVGGRFKYEDDANTPNTQFMVMKWKVPIIFGSRNMPMVHPETGEVVDTTAAYHRFGTAYRFSNIVKCEDGFFAVRRGNGSVHDNDGKEIQKIEGDGGGGHMQNWVDACHSRKVSDLNADVLQGHLSSVMLHTGMISYQVGAKASPLEIEKAVDGIEEAEETWKQTAYHLRGHDVDLDGDEPATLGPWLTFDPKKEKFTGNMADNANTLLRECYRHPFVIHDEV